ncbi:MAG TPA: ribonuclease H [Polyangiaceae bacterium]|nr:ribonuclease H [Polyangiaceae bacterium]
MPWVEATLRGQRVLARAHADGSLATEGGRVEIRYKPNDGRVYRASPRNLERAAGGPLLPDETCAAPDLKPQVSSRPGAAADASRPGGSRQRLTAARRPPSKAQTNAGAWVAYTDGACSGNPGPAGCGVVLVAPDGKMHEGLEYLGEATNNVAELTGILRAIEWTPSDAGALVVHTDSQYAIGVLQRGWKAKANQELVTRAKRAVEDRQARLVYVPGHQGVALNERADELAREAVQTQRTRVVET